MRQRSMMASAGLIFALGLAAGCGDNRDAAPPPPAAETTDPLAFDQPGDAPVPVDPTMPGDTPTVAGSPAQPAPGAGAPSAQTPPAAAGADPQLIAAGRQVYTGPGNCGLCHGPEGQGGPLGPNLTDGEWIWITDTQNLRAQLVTIIRTGVAQPRQYPAPMPPGGGATLNDEQLEAVAAYIVSRNP